MSFTENVKLEIIENRPMRRHYQDALAYGLFFLGQSFREDEISLRTKFSPVASEFVRLCEVFLKDSKGIKLSELGQEDPVYHVRVSDKKQRIKIVSYFESIKKELWQKDNDEKMLFAFLAGAFLASGSITDPKKRYHMEIAASSEKTANRVAELYKKRLPKLKVTSRRNQFLVYCKDRNQIQDALTMMGASKASLHMIEVEMFKDVRNHANRVTNCDTANIGKQVDAATDQIEDIKLILSMSDEDLLTKEQLETAQIRVENPYSSLRELAEIFPVPISRSGLYHRLATIKKIADSIRKEQENKSV